MEAAGERVEAVEEVGGPLGSRPWLKVAISVAALIAVAVIVALNWEEVSESLALVSVGELVALAVTHLVALVLRAEAWGLCLDAAGSRVPRRELHLTSAPRFLADTAVPTYAGAWVRIGLIKLLLPERAPTAGQMFTADGVLLLGEAVLTVAIVLVVTILVGLPWWWIATIVGVAAIGLLLAWGLRQRFADRPFVSAFDVLLHRRSRLVLTALLFVVLAIQPVRFLIALNAVGIAADLLGATAAFLATSAFGVLPIGPGPASITASGAVFPDASLGEVAAAGLILAGAASAAALLYCIVAALLAGPGVRASLRSRGNRERASIPARESRPR